MQKNNKQGEKSNVDKVHYFFLPIFRKKDTERRKIDGRRKTKKNWRSYDIKE